MKTTEIKLRDEYIRLGQALKAVGVAETGVDAKFIILSGEVLVNGKTELQRGKKLREGDEVVYKDNLIRILPGVNNNSK